MTVEELVAAAEAAFKKTTDPYPTWVKKGKPTNSNWAKGFAFLDQIVAPPPVLKGVKAIYNFNQPYTKDWEQIRALGINTLYCDASDLTTLKLLASEGCKGWIQPGYWTGSGFSRSDAEVAAECKAAFATGAVEAVYVADEPKTRPDLIKARSDLIKNACPGIKTMMTTWDPSIIKSFAHVTDYVGLDGYPNQRSLIKNGVLDMSIITDKAKAADAVGWPYIGIIGAFGSSVGGLYKLPTAAELQAMWSAWDSTNQIGYAWYAWGPEVSVSNSSDYLENHPELLAVIQHCNSL